MGGQNTASLFQQALIFDFFLPDLNPAGIRQNHHRHHRTEAKMYRTLNPRSPIYLPLQQTLARYAISYQPLKFVKKIKLRYNPMDSESTSVR